MSETPQPLQYTRNETSEDKEQKEFNQRLVRLESQFPNKVLVLQEGSIIYQRSSNPRGLVKQNSFNPRKAGARHMGAVYFTPVPIPDMTNIQVALRKPLILVDVDALFSDEQSQTDFDSLFRLNEKDWTYAQELGFDGKTQTVYTSFTQVGSQYAREIELFPQAVEASINGNIRRYTPQQ